MRPTHAMPATEAQRRIDRDERPRMHVRKQRARPINLFGPNANMKPSSTLRHTTLTLALSISLCGMLAPFAPASAASSLPGSAPTAPRQGPDTRAADDAASPPSDPRTSRPEGNIAELQSLVQAGSLTELRATRNGSYGAKLFFLAQEMLYYVALSQDDRWWRVVKTQDAGRADSVYAEFARKSFTLADGEIRRIQLTAQKALLDRVIARSSDRANRLSADLALAQQQDSQVSQRQQQLQAEAATLQSDKLEAERKLRALQMQVDQLQRATEAGLGPSNTASARRGSDRTPD
jgi:hypothetical protein